MKWTLICVRDAHGYELTRPALVGDIDAYLLAGETLVSIAGAPVTPGSHGYERSGLVLK